MKLQKHSLAVLGFAGVLTGIAGASGVHAATVDATYKAELLPLNEKMTGSDARGDATFTISGDRLTIRVTAKGVAPEMEHLQHFHGFNTGDRTSRCPSSRDDKNGDGVIDMVETEPVAGTTMVPFHDDPASMTIVNDTYPKAGSNGSYSYEKTVSLKALEAAFAKKFPGQQLDLDQRVVFLHGVSTATKLPATVASLDDIPAQVTLPIACGPIRKIAE
ncbi:hypothetical protein OGR47_18985 (plasmid) [Methylocystis sp. MJC1]|uniref:hypothetical protein n=1 Tax=Methylocystis sp. MJC1 TaxID=2654282 RepID=UPI0013EDFD48|nr:hypothetical protein [Methylocystis sp. MJC1]MBU6529040.1 hypothetical protein [Methylocystis sp. MJC1]UZX13981.1 hypothetical protein OGR47_18985 [Methylocystis sp. MJC1]